MRKLVLALALLALVSCGNSEIKDYLEERTDKVINVMEVSDKRDYITLDGWDNGKQPVQENVYSRRVKYSVGNDIVYTDIIYDKETNKIKGYLVDGHIRE